MKKHLDEEKYALVTDGWSNQQNELVSGISFLGFVRENADNYKIMTQ